MVDAMFEMPSKNQKSFEITIEYAKSKLEKSKMKKLEMAS